MLDLVFVFYISLIAVVKMASEIRMGWNTLYGKHKSLRI